MWWWRRCLLIVLTGQSRNKTFAEGNPVFIRGPYLANRLVRFKCSLHYDDSQTDTQSTAAPPTEGHLIKGLLLDFLRGSVVLPLTGTVALGDNSSYHFRHFDLPLEFDVGVSRQNRSVSALWLSAYIGNYMGNCLCFVNEFIGRIEVETDKNGVTTKLVVEWERVAAALGGLVVFQLLCALAALLYCRGGFEVVDNVSKVSSMLTGLPVGSQEQRHQEGAIYQGMFIAEGDEFRWVLGAGAGKTCGRNAYKGA